MRRADHGAAADASQSRVADTGVKAMIPFRRPFLDYVLGALADAGCLDVCLVIGPEHGTIRDYYERDRPPERVRVSFAIQAEPLGTADAVLSTEAWTEQQPFLVLNSDNYYPVDVLAALVGLTGPGLPAFRRSTLVAESNINPERVRSFALLAISSDGLLEDIVEKPDPETFARFGEDARVSMNCWRFDSSIFAACRAIPLSPRGELELPHAVRHSVRELGTPFRAIPVDAGVLDLSSRDDIAEVERRLEAVEPHP
jgi:glucose-1-phosphate thymidylyltransferase